MRWTVHTTVLLVCLAAYGTRLPQLAHVVMAHHVDGPAGIDCANHSHAPVSPSAPERPGRDDSDCATCQKLAATQAMVQISLALASATAELRQPPMRNAQCLVRRTVGALGARAPPRVAVELA